MLFCHFYIQYPKSVYFPFLKKIPAGNIRFSSTKYEWDSIKLEFDDSWFNEKYNKWENNPDLIVKASEFVGDNYALDEGKFKEKLRWIILRIIEREDFEG